MRRVHRIDEQGNGYGLAYVALRYMNVYGPRMDRRGVYVGVIVRMLDDILSGRPPVIYGDGTQTRAFSYIEDSLPAYLRACDGAADGHIVNVGGVVPVTIGELAAAVQAAFGAQRDIRYLPARHGDVHAAFSTFARSEELLGYRETVGWQTGVARMVEWARSRSPVEWNDTDKVELPDGRSLPAHWR